MSALPSRRLCLTGPTRASAAKRWLDAVYTVPGWTPLHMPLVQVVPVAVPESRVPQMPTLVAVTSQNALPALKRLWSSRVDIRQAKHAAVGIATARALRALGVDPVVVGPDSDAGAAALAVEIEKATTPGQTVLWPRGDRASDLRERLVVSGRIVVDPIAYRTEDIEGSVIPSRLSAAFFASPSAVQVWLRTKDAPRVTAIAIGQSTHAELAPEYARFTRIVRLPRPTPAALAEALDTLPT